VPATSFSMNHYLGAKTYNQKIQCMSKARDEEDKDQHMANNH